MSKTERAPGVKSSAMTDPEIRLERLHILMSYDQRAKVDAPALAQLWGVSTQMIGGLMNSVLNSDKAQLDLIEQEGFTAPEFPSWWYQPEQLAELAIAAGAPAQNAIGAPYSSEQLQPLASRGVSYDQRARKSHNHMIMIYGK